jgi:hypothetical protein
MRRLCLMLLPLLAGCAIEPPLETRLQPFVGQSEAALVASLGVPNSTYETEGLRFLQYEDRTSTIYPGDPYWGRPYGRFGPVLSPAPLIITRTCSITFTLRQGQVTAFSFRGNGCR